MPALLFDVHAGISGLVLAATAKKSSGSPVFLILIVIMLGVYLLWLRPQRRRQHAATQAQHQAEVGDEVVTAAGIYGRVVAFDGDRASVEIAPGMTIEVARRALGQRVDPVVLEDADGDEDPGTGFGHPGYDGHDELDEDPPHPTSSANGADGGHGAAPSPGAEDDERAPGGSS